MNNTWYSRVPVCTVVLRTKEHLFWPCLTAGGPMLGQACPHREGRGWQRLWGSSPQNSEDWLTSLPEMPAMVCGGGSPHWRGSCLSWLFCLSCSMWSCPKVPAPGFPTWGCIHFFKSTEEKSTRRWMDFKAGREWKYWKFLSMIQLSGAQAYPGDKEENQI